VQGPPRPPRIERPTAVTDLAVTQRGQTLELSFTLPLLATDGERLTKPLELQVFRSVTPAAHQTPNTSIGSDPWRTLLAVELTQYRQGTKIVFPVTLSEQEFRQGQGATFTFAVRSLTRGFRHRPLESALSNVAHITLLDVPKPVRDLQVRATETALELSWSPPDRSVSGEPLSGSAAYRVYRSRTGRSGPYQLLAEPAAAHYQDRDFEFNRTYFYKVAALVRQAGQVAESDSSAILEFTPHDTFPPAAPRNLAAIHVAGAVELIWAANTEADLGGYNVYRRAEGRAAEKVNPEPLRTPLFRDSSVEPGQLYFYYVTALDLTNNESPPSQEIAVETR
jgi:hypothetical protein